MVEFGDLVGVDIAPVSKNMDVKWCIQFSYLNFVFQNQDFSLVRNLWSGHVTIVKTTSSQMSIKKLHSFNGFFLDVSACLVKIETLM